MQTLAFQGSDLSPETLEWLNHYNTLAEEEQLSIIHIPFELHDLCGYPTVKETEAATDETETKYAVITSQ